METKPKYQILKEHIVELIESGILKQDDKLSSENQLAKSFDISRHTVRQAIGELTNENILYRIQGKGTFISAPDLIEGKKNNKLVGVMTTFLNDYIFPSIIRGIDEVLSYNDYSYILNCTLNNYAKERQILLNLMDKGITGLIVEPVKSALDNPNIDLYKQLMGQGVKVIFIHGYYQNLQTSTIVQDDKKGGYLATRNLLDNGLKSIGGIFKFNDMQGRQRYEGTAQAVKESGRLWEEKDILWLNSHKFSVGQCRAFTWDLLTHKRSQINHNFFEDFILKHDGFVIYNEQIAVVIMDYIKGKNLKIPSDISVVTFDDSPIAVAYEPKITTISHPKNQLGRLAAEKLLYLIAERESNESPDIHIVLEPELLVRDSVRIN